MDTNRSRINQVYLQEYIRTEITKLLKSHGYKITYDNKKLDGDDSRSWVFRIVFKGSNTLEVFNDDWRDYTEYFRVKFNTREILIINVNDYDKIDDAAILLKNVLLEHITRQVIE